MPTPTILTVPQLLEALREFEARKRAPGFITVQLFGDGSGFVLQGDDAWHEFNTPWELMEYLKNV